VESRGLRLKQAEHIQNQNVEQGSGGSQRLIRCAGIVSDAILTQRLGGGWLKVRRLIQKQAAQPAQVVRHAATDVQMMLQTMQPLSVLPAIHTGLPRSAFVGT